MATIKEVSRLAQVSMATVSRVLNGNAPVAEQTRQRVLAAVDELGYTPNVLARGLATNRSGGVGVTVNDLASPFYGTVLKGIESVVEAAGMHLLVSSGHADPELERAAIDFLSERRPDALIVQLDATADPTLLEWARRPVPLVIYGRYVAELADRCIYLDNEVGGYLATRHLLDHGHRRIGHVAGSLGISDSRARLHGYRRALEDAGLRYDEALVVEADFQEEGGQQATRRLLERHLDLSAIFVSNDQMAAGALHTLREAGLTVPDDVSLVGYDDVLYARYLYPALTTVRQPLFDMGQAAGRLALDALQGKETGVRRRFEPLLIPRQSVKRIQ